MKNFKVVIPARFASQRLPGKMLAEIEGRSLILRTVDQVRQSKASEIVVATDDERILKLCIEDGVNAIMTSAELQSGTDRVAEVAVKLAWHDDDVVINVQGDEPFLPHENIDQLAQLVASDQSDMATLATTITSEEELNDANCVKVICDCNGRALYFSRSAIPNDRDGSKSQPQLALRHIGVYGYSAAALVRFSQLQICQLEQLEKLEQLRALWHGWSISVGIAKQVPAPGVDTPEDLEAAKRHYRKQDR